MSTSLERAVRLRTAKDAQTLVDAKGRRVWFFLLPLVFTVHLVYTAWVIGLRGEHIFFYLLVMFLCYGSDQTRRFLQVGLPIWIFGACYDSMRLIPEGCKPGVHVADLYQAEKALFGMTVGGKRLILAEFFYEHHTAVLDLLCGILYLTYLAVFILFLLYLFLRDFEKARLLGWSFCILNLLGVLTFQVFPAAPPWYVMKYGLGPADPGVPADPAGAARFDALIGYPICEAIYRKSPDVFGALPSLHVANPVLLFLFARHLSWRWAWGACLYALGVAFSAVYLSHHYVLDIAVGILYAGLAYLCVPWGYERLCSWKLGSTRVGLSSLAR